MLLLLLALGPSAGVQPVGSTLPHITDVVPGRKQDEVSRGRTQQPLHVVRSTRWPCLQFGMPCTPPGSNAFAGALIMCNDTAVDKNGLPCCEQGHFADPLDPGCFTSPAQVRDALATVPLGCRQYLEYQYQNMYQLCTVLHRCVALQKVPVAVSHSSAARRGARAMHAMR
eukprot:SAG31_NODE_6635_length_1943_cov_1.693601_2_plen_170_part_00